MMSINTKIFKMSSNLILHLSLKIPNKHKYLLKYLKLKGMFQFLDGGIQLQSMMTRCSSLEVETLKTKMISTTLILRQENGLSLFVEVAQCLEEDTQVLLLEDFCLCLVALMEHFTMTFIV